MVEQGRVPYHEHHDDMSDVRAALAASLDEKNKRDEKARRITWWMQIAAYGLIVAVAVFGAWRQERLTDDLCAGATENRKALRSLVVGVGNLGENLVIGDAAAGDFLTPQQTEALERIDNFQTEQLKTLELPICER